VAQYLLGYDVNTTSEEELRHCAQLLQEQKPLVQQYVMDQVYSTMINGEAYIAPYYAGDCMQMMDSNPDLAFYLPEDQGFNMFIDSMCIPSCAQEKEAAETFINFLCDPSISGANMDYICYASPIAGAKEHMDEYLAESDVIYPDEQILSQGSSYSYLPEDITRLVEKLFMEVRNG
jgi:spermidine/putrescine transport system substrate-binding protein